MTPFVADALRPRSAESVLGMFSRGGAREWRFQCPPSAAQSSGRFLCGVFGEKERVRAARNVALFIGIEVVYAVLLSLVAPVPLRFGASILIVACVLTLPMLPIYLAVVAHIPRGWRSRRQRLAEVAASPLLLVLFALVLGAWIAPTGLALLLVAMPGAIAYGSVVRLSSPPPMRRSVVDA